MKELYEDKLRDVLETRIEKDNRTEEDKSQDALDEKALRQKQTKLVLHGFSVELQSTEIENKERLNNK